MTKTTHLPQVAKYWRSALSALLAALSLQSVSTAQTSTGPLIAREEMQLAIGDKIVDTIRKGDMLNVVEERDDAYVIATMSGVRGAVDKVNALMLAEAAEIYTELIEAEPKAGQLYTLRASSWWARGENEKALADYDKAIRLGYAEPHAFSSRGLFHASMGNHSKALADYSTAIKKAEEIKSEDESPYVNRAAIYVVQKKFDEAIADYNTAIELKPKSSGLYQQRAMAYKLSGSIDEAIRDFSRSLQLQPKSIAALMGRGYLWFQKKDHERAIADFTAVIELNPEAAQAFNNRGYNHKELGQVNKALADYNKAIELSPRFGLAYQNKGWLLATCDDDNIRNGKEAVLIAKKACELNNYSQISDMMTLAAALAEVGDFKEAIGWQEKVIDIAKGEQREFAEKVYAGYKQEKTFLVINKEVSASSELADAS